MSHRGFTTVAFSLTLLLFVCVCNPAIAQGGKKPPKPSGSADYSLVVLPDSAGVHSAGSAAGLSELRSASGSLLGIEVVGAVYSSGQAYYWLLDDSANVLSAQPFLDPLGAASENFFTDAQDINTGGVVVGFGGTYPDYEALVWSTVTSLPRKLPLPEYADSGLAYNINNHGLIVGELRSGDASYLAVWRIKSDGTFAGPAVLADDLVRDDPDVNDQGVVVATTSSGACSWNVSWNGTSLSVSEASSLPLWIVTGVNEFGDVCGEFIRDGVAQGCILTASGAIREVADLVNNKRYATSEHEVLDLNDAATVQNIQVAGRASVYEKRTGSTDWPTTVLWQGENATELQNVTTQSDPQLVLQKLYVVSNAGWLAGYAHRDQSSSRPVVLVPTDTP